MLSAIVLAAGLSERTGDENKLLLSWKNKTIIQHVIDNICVSGTEEIIVVTGHQATLVENMLKGLPVKLVYNPYYTNGMTTSIQEGVRHAAGNGYMICPGDRIMIRPEEYGLLRQAFEKQYAENQSCICVPRFDNKKGSPVVFSAAYKSPILKHTNRKGCNGIIQSNKNDIHWVDMPEDNVLQDMDCYSDYGYYLNHFFNNSAG
jgi:molybdenum cofactor cytidylyltransferase